MLNNFDMGSNIETDRIILRPWRVDDAEALYRYASDKRVSKLALWPRHTSVEMSRQVITDYFMNAPYTYAIVLKDSNEPIGSIGLVPQGGEHYNLNTGEREVGYWIGYPHWGKGLMTEALNTLIDFAKNTLQLQSLLITADARNIASHRVAEKCKFKHIEDYIYDNSPGKAFRLSL